MAFFAGYPGTLLSYFVVREGQIPRIEPASDDDDRLLHEIRVDRELRTGEASRQEHAAEVESGNGESGGPPGD